MDFATLFGLNELSTWILLAATVTFGVVLFFSTREDDSNYKNLPRGPRGLPILGNLLMFRFSKNLFQELTRLSKIYGKVMALRLGSRRVYILNSYNVIKEAFIDKADQFSERPTVMANLKTRKHGILFNPNWHDRRRFMLVSMRDFGLGKKSLEDRMREEASFLLQELESKNGQPFDPTTILPFVTGNIICSIILGQRFQYDDAEFKVLLNALTAATRRRPIATAANFLPFLGRIPFLNTLPSQIHPVANAVRRWRKEHEETFDADNIRDLVDLFIAECRKEGSKFDEKDLQISTMELFGAGTETTSTTLAWALLYLIHNPDVQEKCRAEITDKIGRSRLPEYSDLKKLPYTNAVMNEVQRFGNIAPLGVPHFTSEDTELAGYTIPKNSVIMPNLHTALADGDYWKDPLNFNPDQWLDDEGKLMKNTAFIPFSMGKRVCLGEQLARKEYFIFFVTMMQNFKFTMVDKDSPPSLKGIQGGVRSPGNYELKAIKV